MADENTADAVSSALKKSYAVESLRCKVWITRPRMFNTSSITLHSIRPPPGAKLSEWAARFRPMSIGAVPVSILWMTILLQVSRILPITVFGILTFGTKLPPGTRGVLTHWGWTINLFLLKVSRCCDATLVWKIRPTNSTQVVFSHHLTRNLFDSDYVCNVLNGYNL